MSHSEMIVLVARNGCGSLQSPQELPLDLDQSTTHKTSDLPPWEQIQSPLGMRRGWGVSKVGAALSVDPINDVLSALPLSESDHGIHKGTSTQKHHIVMVCE